MKYIIYGPPAAGKSSLARYIPTRIKDASVIHLEKVRDPNKIPTLAFLHTLEFRKPLFVTAANLEPKHFPPSFEVIFLIPDTLEAYQARYAARNAVEPGKANQNEDAVYAGMKNLRDHHPGLFRVVVDPLPFEGNWSALLDTILTPLGLAADMPA